MPQENGAARATKTLSRVSAKVLKGLLKVTGVLVLVVVVTLVAFAGFFFATPEIVITSSQIRWALDRFSPESVLIGYRDAEIKIIRPQGLWFAKHVVVQANGLCVRYEVEAVRSCFSDVKLGATGGWGGKRLEGEPAAMPRLMSIDPIWMIGGETRVDTTAFPKEEPKSEEGGISIVDLLRKQILPKWQIEGSRIELGDFQLKTESDSYDAAFDLTTQEEGETVRAILHRFQAASGDLKVAGKILVTRPENWLEAANTKTDAKPNPINTQRKAWKVLADAGVKLKGPARIDAKADADIYDWQTLDFRIGTNWKGVSALREARLEGALKKERFDGKTSVKFGAFGAEVRALDFVNCDIDANLDTKVGGVACGPQTVRLSIREKALLRRPDLYTFAPNFNLRVTRLNFGDRKEADFTFDLGLSHLGFLGLGTQLTGTVTQSEEEGLRYAVNGGMDLVANRFQGVVELLRRTPYSIPAPLNILDGLIALHVDVDVNEKNGRIGYSLVPRLDSQYQAIHLDVSGETRLTMGKKGVGTSTEAAIQISKLYLSAPRLDLRIPPQLAPDSRFGAIEIKNGRFVKIEKKPSPPMDFKLRIMTLEPSAIRLATNLTKSPIPIGLDVIYEESIPKPLPPPPVPGRQPASVLDSKIRIVGDEKKEQLPAQKPTIRGHVAIGQTPVELFRRNAVVEKVRVDLLPDGRQKLDGTIAVHYLDYDINVLLAGTTSDPQVRFSSQPPLDDDQILSVLLFGRPLDELNEDQKSSVSNSKTAFANAALGLTSLYVFASTPIESIGYDPVTQSVTARVGLGGGATLEVGSGGETLSTVGFRKRLSQEFVLRSDVETVASTGKRTVSALIEWVKRF